MRRTSLNLAATVCLLGATLTATKLGGLRGPLDLAKPLSSIETTLGGWAGTDDPLLPGPVERNLAASSYLSRTYHADNRNLHLFIAFYANQSTSASMHSPKVCLLGSRATLLGCGPESVRAGSLSVDVNRCLVVDSGQRMLMLYWYQTRRRIIANEYLYKVFLGLDACFRSEWSGSLVRVSMPDGPTASKDAIAFASELIPQIRHCFGTDSQPSGTP